MKRLISILGSTGSIGLTTLKIIDKKKNYFEPYFFAANKNYNLICKQIKKYKPHFFLIHNQKVFIKVKKKFKINKTKIINSLNERTLARVSSITVTAIPGLAGLPLTLKIIKKSKKMLIANKESIVCGWSLINKSSLKYKTEIIPVDSEHFSILKLIKNTKLDQIEKVYLTASGGPFLDLKKNKLKTVKPEQALRHPKWDMGKKISIDSSNLINKVLEYIEAQKLFNLSNDKLEIIIHPESLVHAIVKFKNGLTKFIYHETSMIIPLANAIFNNNFSINKFLNNKKKIRSLTFKRPNKINFPIIKILNRVNEFPSTSIIVNASNEVLVDHFLRKKVPFLGIPLIIQKILNDRNYKKYAIKVPKDLKHIYEISSWAKDKTIEKIKALYD